MQVWEAIIVACAVVGFASGLIALVWLNRLEDEVRDLRRRADDAWAFSNRLNIERRREGKAAL